MIKRCIACGREQTHELYGLPLPAESPADAHYQVACCSVCGLESSHPMPTDEELAAFYVDAVQKDGTTILHRLWRRRRYGRLIRTITRHAAGSGLLVEVGAGNGFFLRAARRSGAWKLVATEYSEAVVGKLSGEGFDIRRGALADLELPPGSADVIYTSHVVEHIPDLEGFLREVAGLLKPGGSLVALTPSKTSLQARLGRSDWHLINPPGHLWSFSPETFRKILEQAGFTVVFLKNSHLICEMLCVARK